MLLSEEQEAQLIILLQSHLQQAGLGLGPTGGWVVACALHIVLAHVCVRACVAQARMSTTEGSGQRLLAGLSAHLSAAGPPPAHVVTLRYPLGCQGLR